MLLRRLATVALAVLVAVPGVPAEAVAAYTADGLSAAQVTLAEWAMGRFAGAGLHLPALDFVAHPTEEACRGGRGYYTEQGSRARIDICTSGPRRIAEIVFLHEAAHAWDGRALSDERRAAFMDLRGLARWWDDGAAPWHTYGAEQAAQVLVWGLIGRPVDIATIPDADDGSLREAFVLLTGREPPPPGADQRPASTSSRRS